MQMDYSTFRKLLSKDFTDAMIRIGLIAFLVVLCLRVFAPFANLMLWALILAVTLYPLHPRLAKRLRGEAGPCCSTSGGGRFTADRGAHGNAWRVFCKICP